MKFIKILFSKYKIYTSIFVIIILLIISYLIYIKRSNEVIAVDNNINDIFNKESEEVKNIDNYNKIKVDIKGMVNNPGVYELDENSRVIDAINVSGGLIEGADTSAINLSKILKDENVIIIDSIKDNVEPQPIIKYVYKECDCPKFNDACINNNDVVNYQETNNNTKEETSDNESNNKEDSNINNQVSINTGSLQELETLSGVGESKAKAIIKYREENGLFNALEDIMNVSGIGNSLFEKIKDFITL